MNKKYTYKIQEERTHRAFSNPRKGDRFEECYSLWMYVVKVTKFYVYVMTASVPCKFPEDGIFEKMPKLVFKKRFILGKLKTRSGHTIPSYSFLLCDRKNNVSKWTKGKKVSIYNK